MSLEELIQSYPQASTPNVLYFIIIYFVIVSLIGTLIFKNHDLELREKATFVSVVALVLIIVTWFGYFAYKSQSKIDNLTAKSEWYSNVFFSEYIPGIPSQKYTVVDKSLTETGNYTVSNQIDDNLKSITDIDDVKFINNITEPYVETRYSQGIPQLDIKPNFYDTTLYLPSSN